MSDTSTLRAEVIPARALGADLAARWRALAGAAPAFANPFFSPEFTEAVAQVRDDARVMVLTENRGEAFLPFQFAGPWHRRAGAAERIGGHLSDFFGVVATPDMRLTPAALLRHSRLNAISFSHLPEDQRAFGLVGEQSETGLRTELADGWESYWARRRADDRLFVVDTERRVRKIAGTLGPLRLAFDVRDADELGRELERLIAAKRVQYSKTGAADALQAPWTRALLAVLAHTRAPACTGLLSVLYAGDTWVASHFGLRSGHILHHWFPVYNPELGKFSPGRLLLRAMLEEAGALGIRSFDYGAGDQSYKREFATDQYAIFRGAWYRPNMSALGYRIAQSLAWRLKATAPPKPAPSPAA